MDASRRGHLMRIAAAAAAGRSDLLDGFYLSAVAAGIPVADLQEATLQVFLFAGYPRAIDAFEALARACSPAAPPPPPTEATPPDLEERGRALFGRIYAHQSDAVLRKLRDLHPDFARFVLRDAYGQVLARPFLPVIERELMAVAMLGALGLDAQLRAHVRGAQRVGAPGDAIKEALDAIAAAGIDPASARARMLAALGE